jgi:hypothetical protein
MLELHAEILQPLLLRTQAMLTGNLPRSFYYCRWCCCAAVTLLRLMKLLHCSSMHTQNIAAALLQCLRTYPCFPPFFFFLPPGPTGLNPCTSLPPSCAYFRASAGSTEALYTPADDSKPAAPRAHSMQ